MGASAALSASLDEEERELRMTQTRMAIELKRIDAELKRSQPKWEPWTAIAPAFGPGAAVMGAATALMATVFGHFR